ncbi:helix-turn-helix domain-containing protein [Rhizobium rosettiformans]|uniref:helix-turn-helix domain-containing protein n=1 Tax=Rhizobium rosettiformans TaxID=1368430 RepID=UPI00286AD879|nr:helix-turn-helix transcriptional regulator [Rhizobium rosettiformans]
MKARQIIAWNLRHLRVAKGLSQELLAADAGVDRAYFAKIEAQAVNVGVDVLDKLAVALNVPVCELFAAPPSNEPLPAPLAGGRKRKRPLAQ